QPHHRRPPPGPCSAKHFGAPHRAAAGIESAATQPACRIVRRRFRPPVHRRSGEEPPRGDRAVRGRGADRTGPAAAALRERDAADAVPQPATGPGNRRPPRRLNRAAAPRPAAPSRPRGGSYRPPARQSPPIPTPPEPAPVIACFRIRLRAPYLPRFRELPLATAGLAQNSRDLLDKSVVNTWWHPKSFRRGEQGD